MRMSVAVALGLLIGCQNKSLSKITPDTKAVPRANTDIFPAQCEVLPENYSKLTPLARELCKKLDNPNGWKLDGCCSIVKGRLTVGRVYQRLTKYDAHWAYSVYLDGKEEKDYFRLLAKGQEQESVVAKFKRILTKLQKEKEASDKVIERQKRIEDAREAVEILQVEK